MPLKPTELDWRIVHVAIACCWTARDAPFSEREVREKCYRSIRDAVSQNYASDMYMVPDGRLLLDCSALTNLWVPSLDAIAAYWEQVFPSEHLPSLQKIADTLADFRMLFPRH